MVMEIIAGIMLGGIVGYLISEPLVKLQEKRIIKRARSKILKQDFTYTIQTDPRQYRAEKVDLKAIITDPNYQHPIITPRPPEKKKEDPKPKLKPKSKSKKKKKPEPEE